MIYFKNVKSRMKHMDYKPKKEKDILNRVESILGRKR